MKLKVNSRCRDFEVESLTKLLKKIEIFQEEGLIDTSSATLINFPLSNKGKYPNGQKKKSIWTVARNDSLSLSHSRR